MGILKFPAAQKAPASPLQKNKITSQKFYHLKRR